MTDYIIDYFPDPKYSKKEIRDWAMENVPAWKYMGEGDRDMILSDWEEFIYEAEITPEVAEFVAEIEPKVKALEEGKSKGFVDRVRKFLGRLFGR